MRNHIACQTEESALPSLRELQAKFEESRTMLARMTHALGNLESQMRRDIQKEYETRILNQNQRSGEKVAYLRKRSELHVTTVRAAARMEQAAALSSHTGTMQQQLDVFERQKNMYAKQAEEALAQARKAVMVQSLLQEENMRFSVQLAQAKGVGAAKADKSESSVVTKLEATLVARDRTIQSLREQLAIAKRVAFPGGAGSDEVSPDAGGGDITPADD